MLAHKRGSFFFLTSRSEVAQCPGCTGSTPAARRAPPVGSERLACAWATSSGTVPELKADGEQISTNYAIARFLDERHSRSAAVPGRPRGVGRQRRTPGAVGDGTAPDGRPPHSPGRPIRRDPGPLSRSIWRRAEQRATCLYRRAPARRVGHPWLAGSVFAASARPGARPRRRAARVLNRNRCLDRRRGAGWAGAGTPRTSWLRPSLALNPSPPPTSCRCRGAARRSSWLYRPLPVPTSRPSRGLTPLA